MLRTLLILFLFPFTTISQVEKIKISKEKTCSFEVKIDESIEGKRLRVDRITYTGLDTKESLAAFLAYRGIDLGDPMNINNTEIENMFFKICVADDRYLRQVKVVPAKDGIKCSLLFTFEEGKDKN